MAYPVRIPLDLGSNKIVNMLDPSSAQDAATKNYVDTLSPPAMSYHKVAASGNNADSIKATPGTVYNWTIYNNSDKVDATHVGYPIFVKLYDKASAPNPASDTPLRTIGVQAGQPAPPLDYSGGLKFATGIAIAIVKGIADNDNVSVAASDCVVDIGYF